MKIPMFVFETRVTCVVVALQTTEVLLDVFVIVVEDCVHKRWGQRLFNIDCPNLSRLAFHPSCRVNDSDVVAW